MSDLLTAAETAARLRCSVKYVYQLASSGALPHIKLGVKKGIRFTAEAIDAFLIQQTRGGNSGSGAA
jgi:excisionase family DNA binding protein